MGSSLIQGRTFGLPRSTKRRETNVRKKWRMLFSRYFTPAGFHRLRREWCGFNFVWQIASFAYHRGCLLLTSSLFPSSFLCLENFNREWSTILDFKSTNAITILMDGGDHAGTRYCVAQAQATSSAPHAVRN